MTIQRAVLLDIEGTVTPISFVHETLFPYARANVESYLEQHSSSLEVRADIEKLREEQAYESEDLRQLPLTSIATVVAYLNRLIDLDRKSPALKSIQGKIWKAGYEDGSLKAPVFPDVVEALKRWHDVGITTSIFSSGSELAQKLLFAHTGSGDLTPYIQQYFDTRVGKKNDPQSYLAIANTLSLTPGLVLFVSDVTTELEAASAAGMQTRLCLRPGNASEPVSTFQSITSFDAL